MNARDEKAAEILADTNEKIAALTRVMGIEDAPTELDVGRVGTVAPLDDDDEEDEDRSYASATHVLPSGEYEARFGPAHGSFRRDRSLRGRGSDTDTALFDLYQKLPPLEQLPFLWRGLEDKHWARLGGDEHGRSLTGQAKDRSNLVGVVAVGLFAGFAIGAFFAKRKTIPPKEPVR